MRLHAYQCDKLCTCIHACVARTACVAEYAITCILVRHDMQMYSGVCGRYSLHSRICDYMHACVAETACVAEYATPSLPPSLPRTCKCACMAYYAQGAALCKRRLSPSRDLPQHSVLWAMLCYVVLCLLSLARGRGGQCVVTHGINVRWFDQVPCAQLIVYLGELCCINQWSSNGPTQPFCRHGNVEPCSPRSTYSLSIAAANFLLLYAKHFIPCGCFSFWSGPR